MGNDRMQEARRARERRENSILDVGPILEGVTNGVLAQITENTRLHTELIQANAEIQKQRERADAAEFNLELANSSLENISGRLKRSQESYATAMDEITSLTLKIQELEEEIASQKSIQYSSPEPSDSAIDDFLAAENSPLQPEAEAIGSALLQVIMKLDEKGVQNLRAYLTTAFPKPDNSISRTVSTVQNCLGIAIDTAHPCKE